VKKIIRRVVPESLPVIHNNPLLQQIYAARGLQSTSDLDLGLNNLLPFTSMLGIKNAVECLAEALTNNKRIVIIGDFDTDGATSTALAILTLKAFGFSNIDYLIPNRFEFGYGLTPEIVNVAKAKNPYLLMTVDNGIASIAGVEAAKELGIKVIITDHHLANAQLPEADAIVNPNQPGDEFPSKNLAGVGVVFYVMLALRSYLRASNWFVQKNIAVPNMAQFLDLVALGTVADVVCLDKNNRILVNQGLQQICQGACCQGIKSLLNVAKKTHINVSANDLGFVIAPRINAAGRLDDISLGVECLLSNSKAKTHTIAYQLHSLNNERREIEMGMHAQAKRIVARLQLEQNLPLGLCIFEEDWHQGVLGIIASRLKDCLHRPIIAFAAVSEDEIKGSARSIDEVHMRDVLNNIAVQYPELITKFGGHALAAGLTLKRKNYAAFNEVFVAEINKQLRSTDLQSCIYSDGELPVNYFSLTTVNLLAKAGPWGRGFPEPQFDGIFEVTEQRILAGKHLKMLLRIPENNTTVDAIYFNADMANIGGLTTTTKQYSKSAKVVYRLATNEYNGKKNLQLIVSYCYFLNN
jgi:single-stranded-DNA-specific exonuclease